MPLNKENSIENRKEDSKRVNYSLIPPFPKEFLIDITSLCNHTCTFCSNRKMSNKKHAEPSLVYKILEEAKNEGANSVGLYATGEPFLNKELESYIKFSKKIGYDYVYITTNGAACTPKRMETAINNGLDSLKFSIHGGTSETYNKIHGKNDFERVIKNLKWVDEYRKKNNKDLKIYVTMVETHENKSEVEKLKEIVLPHIDGWDPHLMNNSCGTMPENNEIGKIEEKNIRGRNHSGVCFQPFGSFTITAEGYLSGCVLDYHKALVIGDCNKSSLKDIWQSKIYQNWRKRHLEDKTKGYICYNCIYNKTESYDSIIPGTLEVPVE